QVLDLFAARCARERISVRRRLAPGLPEIQAVPSQMRQVLVNLIINGIQAMPKGGTLTLETRPGKGTIRILVGDTGIGMDGQTIQKIFTPFFTTKDAEHGTGLGLGIVQDIVVSHGGRLSVESRRNAGSRFIVELPAGAAGSSGDRQNG
ncbi:MAG TPA: ATP-binding protein, partial [Holophaga sp.]|nr:ATP-binding protein [Holophaga sp.]